MLPRFFYYSSHFLFIESLNSLISIHFPFWNWTGCSSAILHLVRRRMLNHPGIQSTLIWSLSFWYFIWISFAPSAPLMRFAAPAPAVFTFVFFYFARLISPRKHQMPWCVCGALENERSAAVDFYKNRTGFPHYRPFHYYAYVYAPQYPIPI